MRVQTIVDILQQENQAQVALIEIRKQICALSIPLACELFSISEVEAKRLLDPSQKLDFTAGQSVFVFNNNFTQFSQDENVQLPESVESKLLNLITSEVKADAEKA